MPPRSPGAGLDKTLGRVGLDATSRVEVRAWLSGPRKRMPGDVLRLDDGVELRVIDDGVELRTMRGRDVVRRTTYRPGPIIGSS